jgi:prepilin-type N-terminal cleavage/methylation domain-containing protein
MRPSRRPEAGYSLVELMVVVCLIGILGSMTVFQYLSARPGMQADAAMRVVMAELNSAREVAVSQRRSVQVAFVGVNRVTVTRIDVPSGTTLLRDVSFEANLEFGLVEGAGDTPDAFGNDSASPDMITFNSDGMLVDESGSPVNRTIFLIMPNAPQSFRAVTVLGSTGRVRGYRWAGASRWMRV